MGFSTRDRERAFTFGPPLVGFVADLSSLRASLLLPVAFGAAVAGLAAVVNHAYYVLLAFIHVVDNADSNWTRVSRGQGLRRQVILSAQHDPQ